MVCWTQQVYSGDVDGCVPHLGTRRWVSSLGLRPARPWRSWHSSTGARVVARVTLLSVQPGRSALGLGTSGPAAHAAPAIVAHHDGCPPPHTLSRHKGINCSGQMHGSYPSSCFHPTRLWCALSALMLLGSWAGSSRDAAHEGHHL